MNIALIGYGKMGKAIEEIALQKGHKIVLRINGQNLKELTTENIQKADVVIEFTGPKNAAQNVLFCFNAKVPIVCGTTGWLDQKNEIVKKCTELGGTFLYASNFSIGVNIFFELNKKLAVLMNTQKNYEVQIEETHHTEKKDAPSGTAITLAEQIIDLSAKKNKWSLQQAADNDASYTSSELLITSKRINPAPGTHVVKYSSEVDDIEIIHTAHSRKGFASGALLAAEFIHSKKGIFTMKDVLDF